MKNTKGQALIESLMVFAFTISVFAGSLKVGLNLLKDVAAERIKLDSQLRKKSGFVLISLLLQLPILILLIQVVYASYAFNETINRNLENCLQTAVDQLVGVKREPESAQIEMGIFKFSSIEREIESTETRRFFHLSNSLDWPGKPSTIKLKAEYKCGAEVLCFKENCRYEISADRF